MSYRKYILFLTGLLLVIILPVGVISLNHPIFLKWLVGTARNIGKPIHAIVYTDGKINSNIKVFHVESNNLTNKYLLNLPANEDFRRLKYVSINLKERWIGIPVGTSKRDYDFIAGQLFQSETGSHFTPVQDDIKGLNFDPQLEFTDGYIKFRLPHNGIGFDSIRIELK